MTYRDPVRKKVEAAEGFIHGVTVILSLFPLGYGTILILGSTDVWDTNIHRVTASIPGAPWSWAAVSIILGLWLFISESNHNYKHIAWACRVLTVWAMWLGAAFFIASFSHGEFDWTGMPAVLIYATFASLYVSRQMLAKVWYSD